MARPATRYRNNASGTSCPVTAGLGIPFGSESTGRLSGLSIGRLSIVDPPIGDRTERILDMHSGGQPSGIPNGRPNENPGTTPTFDGTAEETRPENRAGTPAGSQWRGGETGRRKVPRAGRPHRCVIATSTVPAAPRHTAGQRGAGVDQSSGTCRSGAPTIRGHLSTVDWSHRRAGPNQWGFPDRSGRKRGKFFTLIVRHPVTHVCTTTPHSQDQHTRARDQDTRADRPLPATVRNDRGHRCYQDHHRGPCSRYPRLSSSTA